MIMDSRTILVEHQCEDCGHIQQVIGILTSDNKLYMGSGQNWCDACETGLPKFTNRIFTKLGENQTQVVFFMKNEKMAFQIGNQIFTLDYEPEETSGFVFMTRMLLNAFSKV